jgi:nitrogen regulatory protein P-II 2
LDNARPRRVTRQEGPVSSIMRGCLTTKGGTSMKFVTAIIQPYKLDDVRDALAALGVQGMTITEVRGFGRQKGHAQIYRGAEYADTFVPKLKVEIGIEDNLQEQVLAAIGRAAKTDRVGDGKIFVHGIERAVRIRTGETNNDAL